MTNNAEKKKNTEELNMQYFSKYIKAMREEKNISQEDFCRGICAPRQLSLIESGEQIPDSMMQDALLERLGVGAENYESYLEVSDYERWLAQMEIFNHIIYERWENALSCLEQYKMRKEYIQQNKFEHQFVLAMKGQIRCNQGADREELRMIYEMAIHLTVFEESFNSINGLVLSLKEMNLLLEYERNCEKGGRESRYLEIMTYAENNCDALGIAKIYPKAVYLLCKCQNQFTLKEQLHYCTKALEYLRDTSRTYYLWEILTLRGEILENLLNNLKWDAKSTRSELSELLERNYAWKDAIAYFYDEFHVRKDTFEYTYLYVIKGVSCVNDVIRIRREMLGMSRKELCGEYRDVKTLQRLELKQTSPQWGTVAEMFSKLGLPTEYSRNSILTANNHSKQLMVQLKRRINELNWMEADRLLQNICIEICNYDKHNMQLLMQEEAQIKWNLGECDKEEFYQKVLESLELTLPFDVFLREGSKYLTYQEQTCIMSLMKVMDKGSSNYWTCVKRFEEYYQEYEKKGLLYSVDGMYAHIMSVIASELGNCGRYYESNKYDEIIAEGYLRFRRLRILFMSLYDRWWNYTECERKGIPLDKTMNIKDELEKIIYLADLDKQHGRVNHYIKKLKEI